MLKRTREPNGQQASIRMFSDHDKTIKDLASPAFHDNE